MKTNILSSTLRVIIVLVAIGQIFLFVSLDYVKIDKHEVKETYNEIIEYNMTLDEVISRLDSIEDLKIQQIFHTEKGYEINVEIESTKVDIEKILMNINYFGIISYTININDDVIKLNLTIKEKGNNNCI